MNELAFPNVGTNLDRTTRLLKQHYLRAFREAGANISTEQWVLLDHLHGAGDASQADLAGGTYKDPPTVSRIIDKLAEKGLVERQRFPNDRRRYLIKITDEGRRVHDLLFPRVEALRVRTWRGLSAEDFEHLTGILARIRGNFEED